MLEFFCSFCHHLWHGTLDFIFGAAYLCFHLYSPLSHGLITGIYRILWLKFRILRHASCRDCSSSQIFKLGKTGAEWTWEVIVSTFLFMFQEFLSFFLWSIDNRNLFKLSLVDMVSQASNIEVVCYFFFGIKQILSLQVEPSEEAQTQTQIIWS